jgi:hypothetical protein
MPSAIGGIKLSKAPPGRTSKLRTFPASCRVLLCTHSLVSCLLKCQSQREIPSPKMSTAGRLILRLRGLWSPRYGAYPVPIGHMVADLVTSPCQKNPEELRRRKRPAEPEGRHSETASERTSEHKKSQDNFNPALQQALPCPIPQRNCSQSCCRPLRQPDKNCPSSPSAAGIQLMLPLSQSDTQAVIQGHPSGASPCGVLSSILGPMSQRPSRHQHQCLLQSSRGPSRRHNLLNLTVGSISVFIFLLWLQSTFLSSCHKKDPLAETCLNFTCQSCPCIQGAMPIPAANCEFSLPVSVSIWSFHKTLMGQCQTYQPGNLILMLVNQAADFDFGPCCGNLYR